MSRKNTSRIKATSIMLTKMINDGVFHAPSHQRRYDWNPGNVSELLEDLEAAMDKKVNEYFLGTIMLIPRQSRGGGVQYSINDGQQRLVTWTLIFAKLAHLLGEDGNKKNQSELLSKLYKLCFINLNKKKINKILNAEFFLTNEYNTRITPPSLDDTDYSKLLRKLDIDAGTKLAKAWKRIEKFFNEQRRNKQKWRRNFANYLLEKVCVIKLEVPEDFDLLAIFETLNARGKPLDEVDLLKNYLLHRIDECNSDEKQVAERCFETMYDDFRGKNITKAYVRCHLQAKFGHLTEKNFFREARTTLANTFHQKSSTPQVLELIKELGSDNIMLFNMLRTPTNFHKYITGLVDGEENQRTLFDCLNDLSNYKVTHPTLFALFASFLKDKKNSIKQKEFLLCCRLLSAFTMRIVCTHNIFRPALYEKELADVALKITGKHKGIAKKLLSTLEELDSKGKSLNIFCDDDFRTAFFDVSPRSEAKAKKILATVENNVNKGSVNNLADIAIARVLPSAEATWQYWGDFDEPHGSYCLRLGNTVLLEKKIEEKIRNTYSKTYTAKNTHFDTIKELLSQSKYYLPQLVSKQTSWNSKAINNQQNILADTLVKVWRLQ